MYLECVLTLLFSQMGAPPEQAVPVPKGLPAPDGLVLQLLPLQDLCSPIRLGRMPIPGQVLLRKRFEPEMGFLGGDEPWQFAADEIIEILKEMDPAAWVGDRAVLSSHQRHLITLNTPEIVKRTARHLEQLRLALNPRLSLRCLVYRQNGNAPHPGMTIVPPDQSAELVRRVERGELGPCLYSGRTECRSFDRVFLGVRRTIRALDDIDVEIAQGSSIADPVVATLPLDRGVTIVPRLTPDGRRLVLPCHFAWESAPEKCRVIDPIAKDIHSLGQTTAAAVQTSFATILGPGETLILAPGGRLHPRLRLVLLADRTDPLPEPLPKRRVFPTGLMTEGSLRSITYGKHYIGRHVGVEYTKTHELEEPFQADALVEMIRMQMGDLAEQEDVRIQWMNHTLLVAGPQPLLAKAQRMVDYFAGPLSRRFALRVHREYKRPAESPTDWQPLGPPITIPVLPGRFGFAYQGREESFITDFDTEVAQKARAVDPVIDQMVDGFDLLATVTPVKDRCQVVLHHEERGVHGVQKISSGTKESGLIHLPDVRSSKWNRVLTMRPGATRILGRGPNRKVLGQSCPTRVRLQLIEY